MHRTMLLVIFLAGCTPTVSEPPPVTAPTGPLTLKERCELLVKVQGDQWATPDMKATARDAIRDLKCFSQNQ